MTVVCKYYILSYKKFIFIVYPATLGNRTILVEIPMKGNIIRTLNHINTLCLPALSMRRVVLTCAAHLSRTCHFHCWRHVDSSPVNVTSRVLVFSALTSLPASEPASQQVSKPASQKPLYHIALTLIMTTI